MRSSWRQVYSRQQNFVNFVVPRHSEINDHVARKICVPLFVLSHLNYL